MRPLLGFLNVSFLASLIAPVIMANTPGTENILVDSHIHIVTQTYSDAIEKAGGDPAGFPVPPVAVDAQESLEFMRNNSIQKSILSITSPGPPIAGNGPEGRELTRSLNDELAKLSTDNPGQIYYFASTPDWTDVEGTLQELDYIFSEQKVALGVVVMTTYGDKLLGDDMFKPIWDKLDEYKAIVFIHPATINITPRFIGGSLGQPLLEYPLSTTRTAVDLIMTGRFRSCPNIDIILSHGGGTLPFIAGRFKVRPEYELSNGVVTTAEQFDQEAHRFYMDLALTTERVPLETIIAFNSTDKILFGSDFPYAAPRSSVNTQQLYQFSQTNDQLNIPKLNKNIMSLLQKHGYRL